MNKQELIKKIASDAEVTQRQAACMLESTLNAIIETVAAGEKLQLLGFGTFEPKQRAARTGRNPSTREIIEIPAATVPVFKPGVEFKEAVDR